MPRPVEATASQERKKSVPPDDIKPAPASVPDLNANAPTLLSLFDSVVNMPKPEISVFDGNPENYFNFINQFETNIESRKHIDNKSELTFLIQFCVGKARESIENCVLMNPDEGLASARSILSKQFGQSHQVTNALLQVATSTLT